MFESDIVFQQLYDQRFLLLVHDIHFFSILLFVEDHNPI